MSTITEYQDEYCGFGGRRGFGGGGSGGGGATVIKEVQASYDRQPVGGRMQAKAAAAAKEAASRRGAKTATGLPAYDEDFVATVYSGEDRGTHRVRGHWADPRWSDPSRAATATLYEPRDRDPPNRNNFYTYRTTLVDALDTPGKPLAVPDVHKLRYMHNDYMTYDDWY